MLDIKAVRQDPDGIAKALAMRGFTFDVEQFRALDARRKQADIDRQSLLAERKSASKKIGVLVGQGMSVDDAKTQVNETLVKIAASLDDLTEQARQLQGELEDMLLGTPNVHDDDVPAGDSDDRALPSRRHAAATEQRRRPFDRARPTAGDDRQG